jgi:hypothetical protein
MKNIIIQVQSFGIFESLVQYGALGIITVGLGVALWFLLKRQIASEDKLKTRVDELQKELNDYIKHDAANMKEVLDNNTRVLQDLKDIIMKVVINNKN